MSMTQRQAWSILQAKHGKKAALRDSGKRSGPDLRAYHKEQMDALGPRPSELYLKDVDQSMTVAEYRALWRQRDAERTEWQKERDKHWSESMRYRYSVGHVFGLGSLGNGFGIDGEGDTWEDALRKAGYKLPEKRTRSVPTCKKCQAEHWPFQACA